MKRVTRRRMLRGLAGAAGLAVLPSALSGCGASRPATGEAVAQATRTSTPFATAGTTAPTQEQTALVRFAWWTDIGNPTPFQVSATGPGGAVLLTLIYDTLTWKNETGIIPWLASQWDAADDGSSYTFRLMDSVTWHDGKSLTAEDVKFSFDYYAQHPYKWMATDVIESTEITATNDVHIRLNRPHAAFLEEIAGVVPIIPRHIWEPVADPVKYSSPDGLIGSGPFKLAEYNAVDGAYRLVANQGYWRGRPLIDEWRQLTVPAEARMQAVLQGEADVSLSTDASVRGLLADNPRIKVFETAPLSLVRLVINTERIPLDRGEVRQAIAYALDRAQIAETITRGPAIVGSAGVVPPETPWYNPALKQYPYDPEQARALLGGQTYTLELIADTNSREPDLMQPMLEAVGITLNVHRLDAPTRVQILSEGDFQMVLTSHIGVGGDPDYLRRWYAGEEANEFANGLVFHNPEFAKLGEEQAATLDLETRREIVFRMQEILAEELPTIALYHRRFYWIYDPDVLMPMETWGGLMSGIPFPNNKLTLIEA